MDITIAIATHKQYKMPAENCYLPVLVGNNKNNELNYQLDSAGDNIATKNPNYCELTALYWLFKNNQSDYKGLVHYRRHFTFLDKFSDFKTGKFELILKEEQLKVLLEKTEIVLPKKRHYYIESNYSHYAHAHNGRDLDVTKTVMSELYPDYIDAFDKVMNQTSAHMFNMMIMKRDKFDAYCQWLFDILFEVEKRIDISNYDPYEARVFGFISELLLDVWIEKNHYSYIEKPVMFMEKQNWFKKGGDFLMRKIKGKK